MGKKKEVYFLKHEGHEGHEERIKERLYPAKAQRKNERKLKREKIQKYLYPAEALRRRYLGHGEKMKDNEIGEIPIKGLLGQGLLKEIPRSKKWGC